MYQMPDCHHRVVPDHARERKTHDILDTLAHLRIVTVYSTVLASGFFIAKGTFFQPVLCIGPGLGTNIAKRFLGVILAAVETDHRL